MTVQHYNYNLLAASVQAHSGVGFQTTESEKREEKHEDTCVRTHVPTHTYTSPVGSFAIHDTSEKGGFFSKGNIRSLTNS